jgi:release factor glutamine methyltransferase
MTSTLSPTVVVPDGVYRPQEDSWLLIDAVSRHVDVRAKTVADVCTGSGVVAIAAARAGAARVDAFDVSPAAVRCATANAHAAQVALNVRLGTLTQAAAAGPYDVVVSNPPYVPVPTEHHDQDRIPSDAGPPTAYDAGPDGRLVLDPLCRIAPDLLAHGGTLLIVQSETAGIGQSLIALQAAGLRAEVVATKTIALGPVLSARRAWLIRTGRLPADGHGERLAVILARKP